MTRTKRNSLSPFIFGGAVFLLIAFFHAEIMGAFVYAVGRQTNCPFESAVSAVGNLQRRQTLMEELQATSRLLEKSADGLERWQTKAGAFWIPAGASVTFFGELAEQMGGIYSHQGLGAKKGDVVLDCGANFGLYTKTALDAGASKVIAIEPVPENIKCLRRNFPNEIADGRVVIVEKGVWDKEDFLEMFIDSKRQGSHSFVMDEDHQNNKLRLPLTTIDQLVDDLKLPSVDYVKMDIEGAERHAVAGAKKTLARFHPRMALCVYHLPDDPQVIPQTAREGWPNYNVRCGPCVPEGKATLGPEVFFFF